ncbi:hypothetical protein SAMCFNEI73_pC1259 (plasmid) [Sinorhizobium americanum]|uniref:Uncharacterized protein n=1 Tax=Sinorhizobium americanum TaxID=194963 RepID=A0A1L3LXY2_9HYPH|nr:hypothetical protein SAMCFNEI73_pC1259 [Sinorhizobium americanum]
MNFAGETRFFRRRTALLTVAEGKYGKDEAGVAPAPSAAPG